MGVGGSCAEVCVFALHQDRNICEYHHAATARPSNAAKCTLLWLLTPIINVEYHMTITD